MKQYDKPNMDVLRLNAADIIRTSPGDNEDCFDPVTGDFVACTPGTDK